MNNLPNNFKDLRIRDLYNRHNNQFFLIALILLVITCTVLVCIGVNKYISRKIYLAKWKDYEECGTDSL